MKDDAAYGTGNLPKFAEDLFCYIQDYSSSWSVFDATEDGLQNRRQQVTPRLNQESDGRTMQLLRVRTLPV